MKRILITLCLVFQTLHVLSQNVVYEFPNVKTDYSLIRNYNENVDILYTYHSGTSSFLYFDKVTGIIREAKVEPVIEVTDMELSGDTLFYCGHRNDSNYLCFFSVSGLFLTSPSLPATVMLIPFFPAETHGGVIYNGTFTLSRLEVQKGLFRDGDEFIHVYMIGDVEFGVPEIIKDYSCILDAAYSSGTSQWMLYTETEPDRVYYFDDLTITDNYLWVVGHKHEGEAEYMHGYRLPYNADKIFTYPISLGPHCQQTSPPYVTYWFTNSTEYYPLSRPRIETLYDNVVAVACKGSMYSSPYVVVSVYKVGPTVTLVDRLYVANTTNTDEFQDIKYNPTSDILFLVPDKNLSGVVNALYGFTIGAQQAHLYRSTTLREVHSVDYMHNDMGAVSSGMTANSLLGEWQLLPIKETCFKSRKLDVSIDATEPFDHCNPMYDSQDRLTPEEIIPEIVELEVEKICGEGKKNNN